MCNQNCRIENHCLGQTLYPRLWAWIHLSICCLRSRSQKFLWPQQYWEGAGDRSRQSIALYGWGTACYSYSRGDNYRSQKVNLLGNILCGYISALPLESQFLQNEILAPKDICHLHHLTTSSIKEAFSYTPSLSPRPHSTGLANGD